MKCNALSATKISMFKQCPLKYHAVYELGVTNPFHHHLSDAGQAIHKYLEILLKEKRKPDIEAIYRRYGIIEEDRSLVEDLIMRTLRDGYLDNHRCLVDCEYKFRNMLKDGETVVTGMIDRVDLDGDKLTVTDLKTGKEIMTEDQAGGNYQGRIYALAGFLNFPSIRSCDVVFWFLRHQKRVVTTINISEADSVADEILKVAGEIRGCSDPKPVYNRGCRFCHYKPNCPLFPEESHYELQ